MLTLVAECETLQRFNIKKSPIRKFAEESIEEFMKITKSGEVAEVTEAPWTVDDPLKKAAQLIGALKTEARLLGHSNDVDIFQRNFRVFIRRKRQPNNVPPRKPNPYPYD